MKPTQIMKTGYTKLLEAIRHKDWTSATERFRDIMEQKVAIRLAEEKKAVNAEALTEAPRPPRGSGFRRGR